MENIRKESKEEMKDRLLASDLTSYYSGVTRVLSDTIMKGGDYKFIAESLSKIQSINYERINVRDNRIKELEQQLEQTPLVKAYVVEKDITTSTPTSLIYDLINELRNIQFAIKSLGNK